MRQFFPSLIFVDIKMPGMDGLTATQIIRGDVGLRDVPIVAASGDDTEFNKIMAKAARFDGNFGRSR